MNWKHDPGCLGGRGKISRTCPACIKENIRLGHPNRYGPSRWEFPSLWWWQVFMDGTWACNCTRSREMKWREKQWKR